MISACEYTPSESWIKMKTLLNALFHHFLSWCQFVISRKFKSKESIQTFDDTKSETVNI